MSEEKKVINPKPPTKKDLKILDFMNGGGTLTNENGYSLFKSRGIRDVIYRLNCAGYNIKHRDISYTDKVSSDSGWFRQWFTKDIEVKETGYKTQKAALKKTKSLPEISKNIERIRKQAHQEYNGNRLFNQ